MSFFRTIGEAMKSTVVLFALFAGSGLAAATSPRAEDFSQARINGRLANEGYVRSLRLTKAWLAHKDPLSGLIPSELPGGPSRTDVWEPHNSGADNYAFMVLCAYLLDRPLFEGDMTTMLHAERKLTSRIKSLPDAYSFSKRGFQHETPDSARIVFGAAEYIKDGLIPLAEYIGPSPWTERMIEMLDDLGEVSTIAQGNPWRSTRPSTKR